MDALKAFILTVIGVIGGFVTTLFGGWDMALQTLIIFMGVDYTSGLAVAGIFKKSPKSENGALESKAGWKGIFRKGMALLIVLVAAQLDKVAGTDFIRNAVIIAYIANEAVSITENAGLMGVPIPKPILKAIDILKQKSEEDSGNDK
ncbi:phage holin family protein [Anaerocolumna jejuensis]|uniref:phage holin family protein n=1 Tax=Anaerocolumna jejuensis TaxID=259063 RepID=UPI003F7CA6E1